MLKKGVQFIFAVILLFAIVNIDTKFSHAIELDETTRTLQLEPSGSTVTLTPEQVRRGKRLFNSACAVCHTGGITKTNPNVGLDPESLSLATPPKDNIQSLVDV